MSYNVWWVGQDGNVYTRQGDNVSSQGKLIQAYGDGGQTGFDAERLSAADMGDLQWERIDDPNVQTPQEQQIQQTAPTNQTSSTANKVLNQAAVDNTNKAISSLDTEQNVGYQNIEDDYGNVIGKYDRERSSNKADYDEGLVTNNQNLQKNRQNALVSAAQGLRGLRGVLGSIGALNGDGARLANNAVTTEANTDLGGAQETAATNTRNLDKSWGKFDEEDNQRRLEAQTARTNSRTALEGSVLGKRQTLLQKLASLFGEADNTSEATRYLNEAGNLNEGIAQKSRVQASPIAAKGAAFSPGDLEGYLAGAGDMTVGVQNGAVGEGGQQILAGRNAGRDDERRKKLQFATV